MPLRLVGHDIWVAIVHFADPLIRSQSRYTEQLNSMPSASKVRCFHYQHVKKQAANFQTSSVPSNFPQLPYLPPGIPASSLPHEARTISNLRFDVFYCSNDCQLPVALVRASITLRPSTGRTPAPVEVVTERRRIADLTRRPGICSYGTGRSSS